MTFVHDLTGAPYIAKKQLVSSESNTTVNLTKGNTKYCTGAPTTLNVILPNVTQGEEYICGLIFKAGNNLSFSDTAPSSDYIIYWDREPAWVNGVVYEIIYRCLWVTDSSNKIIISALYSEVLS